MPTYNKRQSLSHLATCKKNLVAGLSTVMFGVNLNMGELPFKCPAGRCSILSALRGFVPQFSHCPSALLCHHCVFLFITLSLCFSLFCQLPLPCRPRTVLPSVSFLVPCLPAAFLTSSALFSLQLTHDVFHIHTICRPLFLSFCIFHRKGALSAVGRVAGRCSLISPPFSHSGRYERSCNNQRSCVTS